MLMDHNYTITSSIQVFDTAADEHGEGNAHGELAQKPCSPAAAAQPLFSVQATSNPKCDSPQEEPKSAPTSTAAAGLCEAPDSQTSPAAETKSSGCASEAQPNTNPISRHSQKNSTSLRTYSKHDNPIPTRDGFRRFHTISPAVIKKMSARRRPGVQTSTHTSSHLRHLEFKSREALKYVTSNHGNRQAVEKTINKLQRYTRAVHGSPKPVVNHGKIARDPLEPVFDQDSITRIKEFCPPDDYSSPDMAANLRLMRPVLSDSRSADVNTLRCITNVNLTLQGEGRCYEHAGDYLQDKREDSLPVSSIWTPRHALMSIAPCITSPGLFKVGSEEYSSGSDSEEACAIY